MLEVKKLFDWLSSIIRGVADKERVAEYLFYKLVLGNEGNAVNEDVWEKEDVAGVDCSGLVVGPERGTFSAEIVKSRGYFWFGDELVG